MNVMVCDSLKKDIDRDGEKWKAAALVTVDNEGICQIRLESDVFAASFMSASLNAYLQMLITKGPPK